MWLGESKHPQKSPEEEMAPASSYNDSPKAYFHSK